MKPREAPQTPDQRHRGPEDPNALNKGEKQTMSKTDVRAVRVTDSVLEQIATKLKKEGLNPESNSDIIKFALQQYLKETAAPVQQQPEGSLLSPKHQQEVGSESSGFNHRESPTGAAEPATIDKSNYQYRTEGASAYPIHPSRLPFGASRNTGKTDSENSRKDSRSELANTNLGEAGTIQSVELSLKQKQSLLYHQLREEQKRETARELRIRRVQQRPIMEAAEPDTHAAPYWG